MERTKQNKPRILQVGAYDLVNLPQTQGEITLFNSIQTFEPRQTVPFSNRHLLLLI
jgi:hypothetical protein